MAGPALFSRYTSHATVSGPHGVRTAHNSQVRVHDVQSTPNTHISVANTTYSYVASSGAHTREPARHVLADPCTPLNALTSSFQTICACRQAAHARPACQNLVIQ